MAPKTLRIMQVLKPLSLLSLPITIAIVARLIARLFKWMVNNPDRHHLARGLFSRLLHVLAHRGRRTEIIRSQFVQAPFVQLSAASGHTHPESACDRSSSSATLVAMARSLGYNPFMYQYSNADVRHDLKGSRVWYWGKDMAIEPAMNTPGDNEIVVMVDVDYYVDMPSFLAGATKPTLLYSFSPTAVAAVGKEYSFTFERDDSCDYMVNGGAQYHHKVWNYSVDTFSATRKFLGIPIITTQYIVERRPVDKHHSLVLLAPIASWYGPAAVLASMFVDARLERLRVACGESLRLAVRGDEHLISTGVVGQYSEVSIPVTIDNTLANMHQLASHAPTLGSIESHLGAPTADVNELVKRKQQATLLSLYHRGPRSKPMVVMPPNRSVQRYQMNTPDFDARPTMHAFMSPIVPNGWAPDNTVGNTQAAVKGRVTDVASNATMSPFHEKCMTEFLERMIPTPHEHFPVDQSEVMERQPRPTQRSILERAYLTVWEKTPLKIFLKQEAYQKPSDPRIITQIPGVTKARYSAYLYEFTELLKARPWYAFGRTPLEIAERVANMCNSASHALILDYSRYDGTISPLLRAFEERALTRFFHVSCHDEVLDLARAQHSRRAVADNGVKYDSGTARASGSPETSAFNTMDNAFVAFVAVRGSAHPVTGQFHTADEAWAFLEDNGLFGGDDGLIVDLLEPNLTKASKRVGLRPTIEVIKRGDLGVEFLARFYGPNVWHGVPNSMCDIKRTLSKFHMTTMSNLNTDPVRVLYAKALGSNMMDPFTPVIGPITRRVLEKIQFDDIKPEGWFAQYDRRVQYPNWTEEWMYDVLDRDLPGIDTGLLHEFLPTVRGVEELLSMPTLIAAPDPPPMAMPYMVNGELVLPLPPPNLPTQPLGQETISGEDVERVEVVSTDTTGAN